MNAEQEEIFRTTILRTLHRAGTTGLSLLSLDVAVAAAGFRKVSNETLESALQYLTDKQLVALAPKVISPANRLWRITAEGTDFVDEHFPTR